MKTLRVVFFLIIFTFFALAIFLIKENQQFIFKNKAVGSNQTSAFRPVIFRTWDYRNEDFAKVCPECGPMGGISIAAWGQVNPGPNSFNWEKLDSHLANASAMQTAPFPDGTAISKPVIIEFDFWYEDHPTGQKYWHTDWTPKWVYNGPVQPECVSEDTGKPVDCSASDNKTKVGHVYPLCNTGQTDLYGVMPAIENTAWQKAYLDFIDALGKKYNNDPRVAGVIASMGMGAEAFLSKGKYDCNPKYWMQFAGSYRKFITKLANKYREVFPNKPVYLTLGGEDFTATVSDAAFSSNPPLGLKSNALDADLGQYEYVDGTISTRWPMANFDGGIRPKTDWAFEDAKLPGPREIYFMTLWVLSGHGTWIDWRDINHMRGVIQNLPKFWTDFVPIYLGKNIDEVKSVWTALRETKARDGLCQYNPQKPGDCCWTSYKGEHVCLYGKKGDFNFWLYHLDDVAGGKTVPFNINSAGVIAELPASAQNQIFAYSLRRTDQATGNKYMYFKIDDNFTMKKEGKDSFELTVVLLNRGSDSFSIEYKAKSGEIKTVKVQKGAGLGETDQFVIVPLRLEEANLSGGLDGGADFRLSSEGDGDEIVHMVMIGEDLPEIKYTAQPVNPTIPPKPTKPALTPSPTGVSSTAKPGQPTASPTPIPSASPTPVPTGTIELDLKLTLQGILSPPPDAYNKITIKVLILTSLFTEPKEKAGDIICNDQGVWEGKITFDKMPLGPKYDILIRIPKHLNQEFTDLTLTEGKNNLDFSGTVILAGDINADGIINSYDLSYIRNNLNSSEDAILTKADLNLDGIVNANDFSLAISGLKDQD